MTATEQPSSAEPVVNSTASHDKFRFEREKVCYEQNCQQMRSLNQIMWQVPIIAMTLTGGLWYAIATLEKVDPIIKVSLLLFGGVANFSLVLMIIRVRNVMQAYMNQMKAFFPDGYASPSDPKGLLWFLRNRSVCYIFSVLMGVAAALCVMAAVSMIFGWWTRPTPTEFVQG